MGEHLFLVARHQPQLLRYLQQEFAAEPEVTVMVDRREGDRRKRADARPMDRRRGERRARADIPQRLASLGYAFVRLS